MAIKKNYYQLRINKGLCPRCGCKIKEGTILCIECKKEDKFKGRLKKINLKED